MTRIYDIADRYVEDFAKLDPVWATYVGIEGYDSELTDYSYGAYEQRVALQRQTIDRLGDAIVETDRDRIARDVMFERLQRWVEWFDSGEVLREVSVMWSPAQDVREVIDLMSKDSNDQWKLASQRVAKVPDAIDSYISLLKTGVEKGIVGSRRIALEVARQARTWAGLEAGSERYFAGLVGVYESTPGADRKVADALRKAAVGADAAYEKLAVFLTDDYASVALGSDGVGAERYALGVAAWLGDSIDVEATYEWGWQELHRIDGEVRQVCSQIAPGKSLREVVELLNDDHERWIHGEDALIEWLQGLLDRAIEKLEGTYFDIPEQIRRISVRIPPHGGPGIATYSMPSDDLRRPGIFWHPTGGRTRFPMWSEISTAYHEGVPGHHLQFGQMKLLGKELSRFQRCLSVAGNSEGWALYAERLMDEFGFLERPEYRLDMLMMQLFRAARVVIDIGLHLKLHIPSNEAFHPGEEWTPEIAAELLRACTNLEESKVESEINRYLSLPGQALAYKVGERVWLEARAAREQRADFDLKEFHREALNLGPMGLAQLRAELLR